MRSWDELEGAAYDEASMRFGPGGGSGDTGMTALDRSRSIAFRIRWALYVIYRLNDRF